MLRKHYKYLMRIKKVALIAGIILWIVLTTWYFLSRDDASGTIFFAIDCSNSMNVQDIEYQTDRGTRKISRLDAVKHLINTTLSGNNTQETQDYGVLLFAHTGKVFIPPTQDYAFIRQRLTLLHTNELPGWTATISSLQPLLSTLTKPQDHVVIFTDGEKLVDTKRNWSWKMQTKIHTIWIGTEKWGEVRYANGSVLSEDGRTQYSSLDPDGIETIQDHRWGTKRLITHLTPKTTLTLWQGIFGRSWGDRLLYVWGVLILLWL